MRKTLFIFFLLLAFQVQGQSVSGYWYGNAYVTKGGSNNNYLVELIIKQNGSQVKGVMNYYFRNSFRSLSVTGNYNTTKRQLLLNNVPITYYGSYNDMEVDCTMDVFANLMVSKMGSQLSGLFVGKPDYRYTCVDVALNLKFHSDLSKEDSIMQAIRNYKETNQVWKPSATDTLVESNIIPRKIVNYVVEKEHKERELVIAQEIEVESDSLSIDFYDNGEIDGDSISIFYNSQLIAANRRLTLKAVHIDLILDPEKEVNEITMFADNLGSIPPNTALMIVKDGKRYYEIRLSSTLEKSATVRIRRKR
jgi:hypothetical protein